jgi:hypothetical protein
LCKELQIWKYQVVVGIIEDTPLKIVKIAWPPDSYCA